MVEAPGEYFWRDLGDKKRSRNAIEFSYLLFGGNTRAYIHTHVSPIALPGPSPADIRAVKDCEKVGVTYGYVVDVYKKKIYRFTSKTKAGKWEYEEDWPPKEPFYDEKWMQRKQ